MLLLEKVFEQKAFCEVGMVAHISSNGCANHVAESDRKEDHGYFGEGGPQSDGIGLEHSLDETITKKADEIVNEGED